ncbi:hypothetical protein A6A04_01715 [Paramagnetospirillum marisnigri]|uniref:Uncharacterized protein n=1 Tax=Paramagnetospirillum marisnigri TaxID=1285242 RepID=A0A178MNM0_9PROT|nr:hypothetical protein [Paramagnetospirillum marisnigri]OAN50153.1 hypothetical protein A6A04_01715 [Paramagnetospirillum marisnigri]
MTTHIRIPDISPVIQHGGDGSQRVFAFPFPVFRDSDVEVRLGTTQLISGFTVFGAGSSKGGAVVFATAPGNGVRVTLRRKQVYARDEDFLDERAPTPHELNDAIDQTVAAVQELAEESARAVKLPLSADLSQPVELGLPSPEAGKLLGWNGSANALVNIPQVDTSDVLLKSQNLADLPDKAQARLNLGLAPVASSGAYADLSGTPSLGSAAALPVDTDPTLAADSDSRVPSQKAVKAYVTSQTLGHQALFDRLAINDLRNVLSAAVNGGWPAESMVGGAYDGFSADTIGATSTNQTYLGSDRAYGYLPTTSYSATGGSGNRSGVVSITTGGGVWNLYTGSTGQIVNGNTSTMDYGVLPVQTDPGNATGKYCVFDFGAGAANFLTEIKGYWQYTTPAGGTWIWQGSNDGSTWADLTATTPWGGGGSSSTVVYPVTGNHGPWRYVRIYCIDGASVISQWLCEVEFKLGSITGGIPDVTLVSAALVPAPASAPGVAGLLVLHKAVDAVSLNTDFTAEATRNGTGWTQGTLQDTGLTISGYKVLWTAIDLSGQASGTTVKYRLKMLNSKLQRVKGVAITVS